jgi:hypothetical protein
MAEENASCARVSTAARRRCRLVAVIDDIVDAAGSSAQSLGTDLTGSLPGDVSALFADAFTSI